MQHYDISLAIGAARMIDVRANYIYFLNGSAGGFDSTIAIRNQSGSDTVLLKPGQAFELPAGQVHERWVISNHAGEAAIVGTLLMGHGKFSDNRISGSVEVEGTVAITGTVDVVDGGKSRTMANLAFWGASYSTNAAGSYGYVQLLNPAASGKNIVVEQVATGCFTASGAIALGINAVAMTNLKGSPASKKSGGVASVAELRFELNAAILAMTAIADIYVGIVDLKIIGLSEPIVLTPGYGLLLRGPVNEGITGNFEFYEDAI
jgi:hypothetical protein